MNISSYPIFLLFMVKQIILKFHILKGVWKDLDCICSTRQHDIIVLNVFPLLYNLTCIDCTTLVLKSSQMHGLSIIVFS